MFATYTHKHVVVQEMRQTWFIQRMPTYSHSTADIVLQKRSVNVVDKTCVMNVGHLSPYTFLQTHSPRHIPSFPQTYILPTPYCTCLYSANYHLAKIQSCKPQTCLLRGFYAVDDPCTAAASKRDSTCTVLRLTRCMRCYQTNHYFRIRRKMVGSFILYTTISLESSVFKRAPRLLFINFKYV